MLAALLVLGDCELKGILLLLLLLLLSLLIYIHTPTVFVNRGFDRPVSLIAYLGPLTVISSRYLVT